LSLIKKIPSLKILIPLILISIFSVISYAATVSITNSTYESYSGISFNDIGGFTAASNGFIVTESTSSATSPPCTWSNGGNCQTAQVAGDWYYSITLTINSAATANTTYTLTVSWNNGAGYSTLGVLTFTTASTITGGQTMTFLLNTAENSFTAPAGMTVAVA
jgi:hypothetical protein